MRAFVLAASLSAASGCVRAPTPLDVAALIAKRGPVEAHRDLAIRVLDNPRDVGARLGLAALADELGRPSEAIEQLEAVQRLGGPLGVRWHASDRLRLARLLLARGRVRLVRGAPTALGDLERAGTLGVAATKDELVSARITVATALVRHVDAAVRARGIAILAALATPGDAARVGGDVTEVSDEVAWRGARPGASPVERGAFGAWLWSNGARREAFVQLDAWHRATRAPRDESLQSAYLSAYAWWTPLWLGELPPPPAEDLVGPERCRFPGADCAPPPAELAPLSPVATNIEGTTGARAAARYAVSRALGATTVAMTAEAARELHAIAAMYQRDPTVADRLARDSVARSIDAALAHGVLGSLFDALGDRMRARAAWQAAVAASDGATAARVESYADDRVPDVALLRGLAVAVGRAGDGPAALVYATSASAASGDPAVVWNAVGMALLDAKQYVDALTAARTGLDLAGPDELTRSLDIGIAANRALDRTAQVDALGLQRAQATLALTPTGAMATDTDPFVVLESHRGRPTAATTARLWVASRLHARDVAVRTALLGALDRDDARRAVVIRELLELAGDESNERALAAVTALRDVP